MIEVAIGLQGLTEYDLSCHIFAKDRGDLAWFDTSVVLDVSNSLQEE